jgi:hypothetical protein
MRRICVAKINERSDVCTGGSQWFFTKRKIYNEGSARWYKGGVNPAW